MDTEPRQVSELKALLLKSEMEGLTPEEEALALRLVRQAAPTGSTSICAICNNGRTPSEAIYDTELCAAHALAEILASRSQRIGSVS
jgi:hypothetical protein